MSSSHKDHNLYSVEIIVSSGPRKSTEAYRDSPSLRELGEDAGGVLSFPSGCAFWIADGTSQESVLLEFSSRILAQDMGMCFLDCAEDLYLQSQEIDLQELLSKTYLSLENMWRNRLLRKWDSFDSEDEEDRYLRLFPECGGESRRLRWSSTFLAGFLSFDTRILQVVNFGDTGGIIYTDTDSDPLLIAPNQKRYFMSLDWYPDQELISVTPVSFDRDTVSVEHYSPVDGFFLLTDGNALSSLSAFFPAAKGKPIHSMERMLRQMRIRSWDDKTLVIGKRLFPSTSAGYPSEKQNENGH